MCGIVGYIGNKPAREIILNGLTRMEYRGYDSAGVALLNGGGISIHKCKGKVKDLKNLLHGNSINGNIGIGHTRWATHGSPNDLNAHPHQDNSKIFTLVHNGIIENYSSLKKLLKSKGIECKTDTDTEVLVQFIGYIYQRENVNFTQTIRIALKEIVGTFCIAIMCEDEPDKIIAARMGAALVLGLGDNETIIASDSAPIIEHTRNIVFMDEGEMAIVRKDSYEIRNIQENAIINKNINKIEYTLEEIEKSGFEHFMLKEIYEQPKSVKEAIRGRLNFENNEIRLGGINDWVPEKYSKSVFICIISTSSSFINAIFS